VNVVYLQATGLGTDESPKDIFLSTDRRHVASMKSFFLNMNLLHVSYSATGPGRKDYVSARRYPVTGKEGFKGTQIEPIHENVDLFKPGETYHITVLKKGGELSFTAERDGVRRVFEWSTAGFPAVTEGRIGLRQMAARSSLYRDIRVYAEDGVPAGPK
jgi:hypothetical protein